MPTRGSVTAEAATAEAATVEGSILRSSKSLQGMWSGRYAFVGRHVGQRPGASSSTFERGAPAPGARKVRTDVVKISNRWSLACMKYLTKPPAGNAFVAETAQHLLRDVPEKFRSARGGDLKHALKDMFEAFPILKNVSFSGT